MAKITTYPVVTELMNGDFLLTDGSGGTRIIKLSDFITLLQSKTEWVSSNGVYTKSQIDSKIDTINSSIGNVSSAAANAEQKADLARESADAALLEVQSAQSSASNAGSIAQNVQSDLANRYTNSQIDAKVSSAKQLASSASIVANDNADAIEELTPKVTTLQNQMESVNKDREKRKIHSFTSFQTGGSFTADTMFVFARFVTTDRNYTVSTLNAVQFYLDALFNYSNRVINFRAIGGYGGAKLVIDSANAGINVFSKIHIFNIVDATYYANTGIYFAISPTSSSVSIASLHGEIRIREMLMQNADSGTPNWEFQTLTPTKLSSLGVTQTANAMVSVSIPSGVVLS